jgi:hypothetical protein
MLHPAPDELKRQGFTEVRRMLRPGGRFLAVDLRLRRFSVHAVLGRLFGRDPERQTSITELSTMLEDAGFGTSARPPSDRLPSWKPFPSAVVFAEIVHRKRRSMSAGSPPFRPVNLPEREGVDVAMRRVGRP